MDLREEYITLNILDVAYVIEPHTKLYLIKNGAGASSWIYEDIIEDGITNIEEEITGFVEYYMKHNIEYSINIC